MSDSERTSKGKLERQMDYTRYRSDILAGSEADLVAAGVVFTY